MEEKNKELKEENKKVEAKKETKKEEAKFQKVDQKDNKKKETKKENKKDVKKAPWVPTIITVAIVLIVAVLLTVMIITSSAPKKSLDSFLNNLKAGDFEKAQEYLSEDMALSTDSLDIETQKLLFDKLEWKIDKVTENDNNTATIEVEIKTKDFQKVINNYMQKALEAVKGAITGGNTEESFSSADFEKYFVEELKNEEIQTITVNATINAVKEDNEWKIVSDENLVDAVLPGLQEAIESLL